MKGSLRTVRVSDPSHKTNFNEWSDPKYKLPPKKNKIFVARESSKLVQPSGSDESLESLPSQTSLEICDIREKIRQGQPLLTKKEVRNFRLPFYESLLLNLKEDGFCLTYEFIRDLIGVDDHVQQDLKADFNLNNRPILKFSKSVLIPLSQGLMKAESSKLKGEKNQEATAFLDLATLLNNMEDKSWQWVVQEMFEQCMEVVDRSTVDLCLKATAKYLYASFLFNELHDLIEAKIQVECSKSLSESRPWTTGDSGERKGNTLYFESCTLLHKIYLEMAQDEMTNQNTEEAILLCRNGLQLAKMINNKLAEANALQNLISIYLFIQQLYSVPDLLQNYMKLCTELGDHEGLCEGYIMYARYHDSVGDKKDVIEDINKLLKIAEENHITKMVAVAQHKLAIHCLLTGRSQELLTHAMEAYMSYLNFKKNRKELDETRCLVGIAQAQGIMSEYCTLVTEADSSNLIDLWTLIRWKNLRIQFFDKKMAFIPEISTNEELLEAALNSRTEELLLHVSKREAEMTLLTSSSKLYLGKPQISLSSSSTRWYRGLPSTSSNTDVTGYRHGTILENQLASKGQHKTDLLSERESILKQTILSVANDNNKTKTIKFKQIHPASSILENE